MPKHPGKKKESGLFGLGNFSFKPGTAKEIEDELPKVGRDGKLIQPKPKPPKKKVKPKK